MSAAFLLSIVVAYFLLLLGIAMYTSRHSNNESFFIGNRNSTWWLVAFGMVGTSLSGVTFVSVPGTVGQPANMAGTAFSGFAYFSVVVGYFLGYFAVAFILLPLYYRLGLTSIYTYLQHRFGNISYKTGALFFILSRTIGATARLYLVINILQIFILDALGVPFLVTALSIILLILLYTFKGGVKTIVYTDTLQTACMLIGLVTCVIFIMSELNLDTATVMQTLDQARYSEIFNTDPNSRGFFLKQLLGGAFITISMTGLDQEMMQKNISVKNLRDSKKNMITMSVLQMVVVFIFLLLGGLLYLYANSKGGAYHFDTLSQKWQYLLDGQNIIGDNLFPTIALQYLPQSLSIVFIIGLISALFPSADGALTALTSSFCIDILNFRRPVGGQSAHDEAAHSALELRQKRTRQAVHLSFAVVFILCILVFKWINDKSIINVILEVAGYTYGPLLGLFSFGLLTRRKLHDSYWVPFICILAPVLCYILARNSASWLGGYEIGVELLIINAAIVYLLLFLCSGSRQDTKPVSQT